MSSRRDFLATGASLLASALLPRIAVAATAAASPVWPLPPAAKRIPVRIGRFGDSRIDDYAWLRPRDWYAVLRDPQALDAPIKAQVLAENAYTEAMLAPARPLQRQLQARIGEIAAAAPGPAGLRSGRFLYAVREGATAGRALYVRRPLDGGPEQVLLDTAAEAQGHAHYALHWKSPQRSADGRLFGWAADTSGAGAHRIRVRETDSGRLLVDDIDGVEGEFAFSPDGRWLFWVARNAQQRPTTVMRRDLVSGAEGVVYEEPDPVFFISLRTTAAGGYLAIRLHNGDMSEVRLLPMDAPEDVPRLVEPRTPGLNYEVEEWDGRLLLLTDADGAEDFKLATAAADRSGRAHWRTLVPHQPGRFIKAMHPFADVLVREEWRDALPRLVLMRRDGSEQELAFDEAAYALDVPSGQDPRAPELVFHLQSPRMPPLPHALDLASGRHRALAAPASGFARERFQVRRFDVHTDDGADVPVTVLMRAGQALDGSAPLYLHGYGSHGFPAEAKFEPAALALVEQGWVYAIAHVRGGAERGTRWWRQVLRTGKKKTFADFIACAEALAADGYTARGRIVAHGLSAGGLLMGAVYTMRPELWAGVIAPIAFVDALTSLEYYEEHPLGASTFPIWGDPRIPAEHDYVASYSPYEQLREAAYPALLATGVVDDSSVSFWEPLKFAIKARTLTTAGNPILSLTGFSGGHMGPHGARPTPELQATYLAFAIWAAERRWGEVPQRPPEAAR